MRVDRFDFTVWGVLGALALALVAILALGDRAGARVVQALPAAGAQVGAFGPLVVEFGQPVRADSLTANFEIDPPAPGQWRTAGNRAWFTPSQALEPGAAYTAQLLPGVVSENGRLTRNAITWQFSVRQPRLLYISPSSGGPPELWRAPLDASAEAPRQLTDTGGKVFDYAAARDGERIAYTVVNDAGGVDIWLMQSDGADARLLADCGPDRCSAPAWAPDGTRLAYSREEQGIAPGAPHGPPRVWTVAVDTAETGPLYQDSQVLGYGPAWSPDGGRLAFFDGAAGGIRVLDLATSGEVVLPTWMGLVGSFSPDGERMYFTDVRVSENVVTSVLFLADLSTQAISVPFGDDVPWSDYGSPAWSPTAEWVAVSLRVAASDPARQLWIMRPDGADARPVSGDDGYTHGAYRWDAWGSAIVFQRVPLGNPFPEPELLVWSFDTDETTLIAANATLPNWLP